MGWAVALCEFKLFQGPHTHFVYREEEEEAEEEDKQQSGPE